LEIEFLSAALAVAKKSNQEEEVNFVHIQEKESSSSWLLLPLLQMLSKLNFLAIYLSAFAIWQPVAAAELHKFF